MKKIIITIVSVLFIGGIAFAAYYFYFGKQLNAEEYYVKITQDGEKTSEGAFNYSYNLPAYNKDGEEKRISFTADKNLRKGAYLKLYYKPIKGVTTFEEVSQDKLPSKAADKLN
ncbi:YxeA family protein [Listeria seeligeri]|uniref:YxeA family protein n=1 Tax=Listeria seeligeri TaxID=1640 RepID=UPI0016294337|nr:YxeA family protein [Listeria seeligeri]MBC1470337.1 YxeA family protein [Listeria seeligeri]